MNLQTGTGGCWPNFGEPSRGHFKRALFSTCLSMDTFMVQQPPVSPQAPSLLFSQPFLLVALTTPGPRIASCQPPLSRGLNKAVEDRPGHREGTGCRGWPDHRLEKACNLVLESEREARVSHWAGAAIPRHMPPAKCPPWSLAPALPRLGQGFLEAPPSQSHLCSPEAAAPHGPAREGNARGWRSGPWAGGLALPPPWAHPTQPLR